ncbi:MAG: hypothetical protein M3Y64_11910, partial [Gemmatimonadota bacterium]|nr:hypothetical protein [Gemmatimonadota bacterium]
MAEDKKTDRPASSPAAARTGLASKVVKDPAQDANAVVLSGFLGDSSLEGHTRLYLGADFGQYVEIPNDGVLHIEEPAAGASALTPAVVWVRGDAKVTRNSPAGGATAGAEGDSALQANQLGGASMGATVPPFCGGNPTVPPFCHPQTTPPQCLPHTVPPLCPANTQPPQCAFQTHPPQCFPHSVPPLCPSNTQPPQCPIHTLAPPCVPHTFPPLCVPPQTLPPQCLPQTSPPQCLPHTFPPLCLPQTSPPQC